jgi:hypothetical protein
MSRSEKVWTGIGMLVYCIGLIHTINYFINYNNEIQLSDDVGTIDMLKLIFRILFIMASVFLITHGIIKGVNKFNNYLDSD